MTARADLLERCLRLEADVLRLKKARRSATVREVAEMRRLRQSGMTIAAIAARCGWARSTVGRCVKGEG
jgi:hypothetical protein